MQTHALETLASWIEATTSQAQFSRDLGISESHLCNLLKGTKRASLDVVERIVKLTNGAVTANDLLSDDARKMIDDAAQVTEVAQ